MTHLKSLHNESEIFVCVFFSYLSSFPIKMLDTMQKKIEPENRKSNPIRFLFI